ncbi:MFS transporter [Klebsiella pneumoniae subsp. pneumoniae]|nr:MFS transporter [Klebsiella pneumoniae subsp. pneumoniae]
MITTLRRSTIALLASSLLLTIGRGATLPFMTIYLTRRFQLEVDVIGYALSLALVVGVLFSMGFGILADRFDKKRYMVWSVLVFILGFSAIPLVNNAPGGDLLCADQLRLLGLFHRPESLVRRPADGREKARIFSLNYTILNIGWTVGPPIGTLLVMHSINLPFWLAAACAAFPLVFIQLFLQRDGAAAASRAPRPGRLRCCCATGRCCGLPAPGCWPPSSAAPSPPVSRSMCWWSPAAISPRKWWPWCCRSTPR